MPRQGLPARWARRLLPLLGVALPATNGGGEAPPRGLPARSAPPAPPPLPRYLQAASRAEGTAAGPRASPGPGRGGRPPAAATPPEEQQPQQRHDPPGGLRRAAVAASERRGTAEGRAAPAGRRAGSRRPQRRRKYWVKSERPSWKRASRSGAAMPQDGGRNRWPRPRLRFRAGAAGPARPVASATGNPSHRPSPGPLQRPGPGPPQPGLGQAHGPPRPDPRGPAPSRRSALPWPGPSPARPGSSRLALASPLQGRPPSADEAQAKVCLAECPGAPTTRPCPVQAGPSAQP